MLDADGIVVESHVVDERLRRLIPWAGGGVAEIRWYEGMVGLDPWKMEEQEEWKLTYLGRYARQPAWQLEQWEVTRVDRWVARISDFLKAENPKVSRDAEQEWT